MYINNLKIRNAITYVSILLVLNKIKDPYDFSDHSHSTNNE